MIAMTDAIPGHGKSIPNLIFLINWPRLAFTGGETGSVKVNLFREEEIGCPKHLHPVVVSRWLGIPTVEEYWKSILSMFHNYQGTGKYKSQGRVPKIASFSGQHLHTTSQTRQLAMRLITTTAALAATFAGSALAACDDVADTGFATLNGGTTGGSGGTEVTATTIEELIEYAAAEGPHVIKVEGTIVVEPWGLEVEVSDDKTIVGVGAAATIDGGGFRLIGVNNVIIRNLRIGNTLADDDGGDRDGVQSDTSSNIWIDHCIFEDNGDGQVDLRMDSTYWTVSNNIFRGQDKTFGIGKQTCTQHLSLLISSL